MSILPTTIPGAWTPSTLAPYVPYYGQGSSNQVYSNSIPVENQASDGDGENQPSRPYIPDSGNSVSFAPFGAVPNANGGIASMNVITLEPASAGFPGGVSNVTQSFSGIKTFVDAINLVPTSSPFVGVVQQASVPILHTFGSDNLFLGSAAGNFAVAGSGNVGLGRLSLNTITSAVDCTGVGAGAARNVTSGSLVTCIGKNAGFNLTTGSNNIFIGANSGLAVGAAVSNVIDIGNGTIGASVNGDIRIGQSATAACYIAGIGGVASGGTPEMVVIDPVTRKMGSQAIAAAGVTTLGPIGAVPNANGATITGTVLNLEPASGTFGGVLTTIAQSIAGVKTFTNVINILATASSGVGVIRQAGNSFLHTFGTDNLFLGPTVGNFTLAGTGNVGVGGFNFGSITFGSSCTAVGRNAARNLTSGSLVTCLGNTAGFSVTTGNNNTFIGSNAGQNVNTGTGNTCLGTVAGPSVTSGGNNILIGTGAGAGITTDSNIIEISDATLGNSVAGDIRIGYATTTACYIAGIGGVASGGAPQMVVIDPVTRKMGSQAIAAGALSLAAIGAVPNANGATLTGNVLNLEPASGTFGGVLTTIAQSVAGVKTFNDAVNILPSASASVGTFQQNSTPILHTFGTASLFLGTSSGNFTNTGNQNTGLGPFTLSGLTTGQFNVAVGRGALNVLSSATFVTAVGLSAGRDLTTGSNNVFMGTNAAAPITTGGNNVIIGASAGFASAVGTSNVIEISDGSFGTSVTGDVRIGTSVSLKCYLGGIKNTTVLTNKQMTVIDTVTNLVERVDIGTTFDSQVCTLDAGAITTMTVRGAATTTMILALSKIGTQVSMRIPAFSLTAQTAAATSFIITGAGVLPAAFRPTYSTWFTTLIFNGVPLAASDCYVTSGGVVTMQLRTGLAFTLPAGPAYDINLQWQID